MATIYNKSNYGCSVSQNIVHTNGWVEYIVWLCGTPVPGRTQQEGTRFHHTAQNGAQFKTLGCLFWNYPFNIFRLCLAVHD
jgi:hypothetical protein